MSSQIHLKKIKHLPWPRSERVEESFDKGSNLSNEIKDYKQRPTPETSLQKGNFLANKISRMNEIRLSQVAEISISYKSTVNPNLRPRITNPDDSYKILMAMWDDDALDLVEEFKIIILNRANRVLGVSTISKGGVSGTLVDAKVVFSTSLKANASAIILAHNHPSGNLRPSNADLDLTQKLKAGGELLDISVIDHLIVTRFGFYSFANEGTM